MEDKNKEIVNLQEIHEMKVKEVMEAGELRKQAEEEKAKKIESEMVLK